MTAARGVTMTLVALTSLGMAAAWVVDCRPSNERARVLEERQRWSVDLRSWALNDDGKVVATLVVSGPVYSELDSLTVRIAFLDAQDQEIDHSWKVLDLSQAQRGAAMELPLILTPPSPRVSGLTVSIVPNPTAEQAEHIRELQVR